MFIGFSVSNFLSFKTTQTMSMIASKVARHKQHILMQEERVILLKPSIFQEILYWKALSRLI